MDQSTETSFYEAASKFSATTRYEQEEKSEGMKSEALVVVVVVVVPSARTSLVSRRTRSVPSTVPSNPTFPSRVLGFVPKF